MELMEYIGMALSLPAEWWAGALSTWRFSRSIVEAQDR
jgi:hypothetical protein